MAANFGVLGVASAGTDSVGSLDSNTLADLTTTTQPAPEVVVIDQYDLAPPAPEASTAGAVVAPGEPDDAHGSVVEGTEPRVEPPSTPPASTRPPTTAAPAPTTTRVESRHDDDDDHEVEDDEHETEHEDD